MRLRPARRLAPTAVLAAVVTVAAGLVLAAGPARADDASHFSGSPIADGAPGTITVSGFGIAPLGASGTLTLTPPGGAALPAYPLSQPTLDVSGNATASVDPAALEPGIGYKAVATIGSTTFSCDSCISVSSDGPHISSITTNALAQGQIVTDVTISGTHFHPGTTIDGGDSFLWKTSSITGTTIKGAIQAVQNATVGDHPLKVVNSDSKNASVTVTVLAGPKVTQLNPSTMHRGTPTPVTITGSGLNGATLSIGDSTVGTVSPPTTTDTTMQTTITFNASINPGDHGFRITSTNGGTYTGTFTVTGELPTAPQNVKVTPGQTTMDVSFGPPALTGGSPILDYTVTLASIAGSSVQTAQGSPIHVTGLLSGTSYAVSVVARNVTGTGPASPTVKTKTKGTPPHIALALSKTAVISGTKITLRGVLPAGLFGPNDLVFVTSKMAGPKSPNGEEGTGFVGQGPDPSVSQFGVTSAGRFSLTVTPYYNTCYTVGSGFYESTICARVITVTKSIAVVRNGGKLTITAQVGPGIHITKSSVYRLALREVDRRGKVLKTLATVKPRDYRQAKGFGRLGANLVKFVIPAPPSGTRLVIVAVHDVLSTPKPSTVFIV